MFKKSQIQKLIFGGTLIFSFSPLLWAEPVAISQQSADKFSIESPANQIQQGPMSLEPALERDGVRVSLRTSFDKKNRMTVVVRIINLSDHPVLVSPNAVEATTDGGFIIPAAENNSNRSFWQDSPGEKAWSTVSKAAGLIPFSTPYRVVTTAHAAAQYASKTLATLNDSQPGQKNSGSLREVILQPGMATHGPIVYDGSFAKAYSQAPTIHIQVKVDGDEPFEFKFAGR